MPYLENYTDQSGANHPNAFIAIDEARIDWRRRSAMLILNVYKDGTAWLESKRPVDSRVIILSSAPDGSGKTFEDFFNLTLLADDTFNLPRALESHIGKLPLMENATLINF